MRIAFFALVVAGLLFGCAGARKDPRLYISNDVSHYIDVYNVACMRDANGFCVAKADVANVARKEISFEWKVQWLDANGVEIESLVNTWQKQAVGAQEYRNIKSVAPSKDAVNMRLYFRRMTRKKK